ncbi:hypothetical protein [Phytoactinopolyspora limicola]|uniref:hypothetical protein n=1 Tax=Phytoactinopolyspora limicola TaxID=2715536 RepID=UPI0014077713|nr:hypothetical protein [Phytoactinopolyspora limicola]
MTASSGARRVVRTLREIPFLVWGPLLLAVVLAAGVAAGELVPRVGPGRIAELEAGVEVDTGPFLLTVERARVLDELPGVAEGDDTARALALVVTVSLTSDRTLSGAMLADSVALRGIDDDGPVPAPNVVVLADGSHLDALQPGLEYEVAMVWEQSAEHPEPVELDVEVTGRTLRDSAIDGAAQWLDRTPVAAGTVPVTPMDSQAGADNR